MPAGAARWFSTRGALVALQVGIATALLFGVGVLLRSLWVAARTEAGVDPRNVVLADLDLARAGYDARRGAAFASRLEEALANAPSVGAAALSIGAPMEGGPQTTVTIDARSVPVDFVMATPGYFDVLRVPLLRGRGFERGDGVSSVDPLALAVPCVVLLLVSLLAAEGPSRRAMAVEAAEALRRE
jgi:hypothetical protein